MTDHVIVFGGSGFIGTHLIRHLAKDDTYKVVSVDLLPPREVILGVDYRIGDVRNLNDLCIDGSITRIYNFAAVHRTPGHPANEYYETNVAGAIEVTAFAERCNCLQIIFTSSISVYGSGEETKDESFALTPNSAYGYSKMLAEKVHHSWQMRDPSRRLTIVRPAVVFGAGERGNFTRMAQLLQKGFFVFPGRRDTIKACIYIEDLLTALDYARQQPEHFVLFNGAYPQRYTIEQIVSAFHKLYYPKAKTFLIPLWFMLLVARILRRFDFMHMGIHPDRVYKLVRSTDVVPSWLTKHNFHKENAIESALARWHDETNGKFD